MARKGKIAGTDEATRTPMRIGCGSRMTFAAMAASKSVMNAKNHPRLFCQADSGAG